MGDYYNLREKYIQFANKLNAFVERNVNREIFNIKKKNNKEFVLFLKKE